MRIFLPLFLPLLLTTCAREATGPDPDETFLAPASAPASVAVNSDGERLPTREEMVSPTQMARLEAIPEGRGDRPLTPQEIAAAKRMGPGKYQPAARPETVEAATPTPADVRPAPEPKSSLTDPSDRTSKPVLDYDRPVVMVAKGACYTPRNCRRYTLTLTNARRLLLNLDQGGKMTKGQYNRLLSAAEYNELLSALEAVDAPALSPTYPTDPKSIPADIQMTRVQLRGPEGEDHTTEVYTTAPDNLQDVLDLLDAYVDRKGWQPN